MLKRIALWVLCTLCFLVSCNKNNNEGNFYTVNKGNYKNTIRVSGYLKAENSINISCPRVNADLTITYLIEDGTMVKPGDTICILDAPEVETNYENALKDLEIAKTEYRKSLEDLNLQTLLLKSQVETIETTAKISKLDSLQQEFSSESSRKIIKLEIQKAELEKQKLENKLKFLKEIHQSELKKLNLKIKQNENNVDRNKDILDRLTITTQKNGIAMRSRSWSTGSLLKEGDIIWNGQPIVSIPDLSSMQANLVLSESNFKRVAKEQNIQLQVDAFPEIVLKGKIKKKMSGGRPIEKNSPIKVYDVIASIDSAPPKLQPGLNISTNVYIEELSDTITVPVTCVFESDSNKVVYVKNKNKYKEQIVEIATQSITQAVVSSGIKEHDIITTFKPPSNKIQ